MGIDIISVFNPPKDTGDSSKSEEKSDKQHLIEIINKKKASHCAGSVSYTHLDVYKRQG